MNKKFIYFKTKTQFTAKLSSLPNNAIVFIEDTKQIWTHGVFFDTSWNYVGDKPTTFTPSAHTLGSHSDVTITSNSTGEILKWNGSRWINNTLAEAGIASTGQLNNYLPLSGGTISGLITSTTSNTSAAFYKSSSTGTAFARIGASTHDKGFGVSNTGEFIFGDWSGVSSLSSSWNKVWHSGNLANGNTTQYIRGDGSLATYSDTTYSLMSLVELNKGTETTNRVVNSKNLNDWLNPKLALKASQSDITNAISAIEIGGRNLAWKSDTLRVGSSATGISGVMTTDGYLQVTTLAGNRNWHFSWTSSIGIIESSLNEGDDFTVSLVIKRVEGVGKPTIYLKAGMGYYTMTGDISENFSTIHYTGKWKKLNSINIHLGWGSTAGVFIIKCWKLEKGIKATDWTPAPEDQVSDWNETNVNSFAFIKNKPTKLSEFSNDLGNYGNWITKAQGDGYYAPKSHTHSYLPLSGGTLTGQLTVSNSAYETFIVRRTNGNTPSIRYENTNGWLGSLYFRGGDKAFNVITEVDNKSILEILSDGKAKFINSVTAPTFIGGTLNINTISATGNISSGGQISAKDGFFQTSDIRLKNIIKPLKININDILNIPSFYFKYKGKNEINIGTSAQEVQKVFPELVDKDSKGLLSVQYDKLGLVALELIKTQQKKIDELENKINLLNSKLK